MRFHASLPEKIFEAAVRVVSAFPEFPSFINGLLRPQFEENIVISRLNDIFNYPRPCCQEGDPDAVAGDRGPLEGPFEDAGASPLEELLGRDLLERYEGALEKLSEAQRQAVDDLVGDEYVRHPSARCCQCLPGSLAGHSRAATGGQLVEQQAGRLVRLEVRPQAHGSGTEVVGSQPDVALRHGPVHDEARCRESRQDRVGDHPGNDTLNLMGMRVPLGGNIRS